MMAAYSLLVTSPLSLSNFSTIARSIHSPIVTLAVTAAILASRWALGFKRMEVIFRASSCVVIVY